MANFINTLNGLVWATPLIVLTFGGALLYTIILKFSNIKNVRLQWKLLKSGGGSQEGISPFETFCSVVAYRVAVGNIGGVMVAILYGGPGAVLWMPITALVTSAISYAENSLGKVMAVIFALFATIGVPFMVTGPSASNISMAFENSLGVAPIISGIVIAVLLFLVISGGIRRIASVSTIIVPFMTIGYLLLTIITLVGNASAVPGAIATICASAFNGSAMFGGMIGAAFSYGVKRAVNSSGAGFGETPASAAAAETSHPATQGLVTAFSVYIDVAVCICSGLMAIVTDCFNVMGPDGSTYLHIGEGSAKMAEQAATNTAGVVWVQEGANTALPIGGILVAIMLACFAYSTCIAYYYEGEAGLAYLFRNKSAEFRNKLIWIIRIAMPIFFALWSVVPAATVWAVSEIMFGLMAWFNLIACILLIPTVKKVNDDYFAQHKAGVSDPYFDPEKLGIENADIWMDINADRIKAGK